MAKLSLAAMVMLLLTACGVARYSGTTKAIWTAKNGDTITYESNKDVAGLEAELDPVAHKLHVKIDKAGTSEAAIAASAEAMKANADVMRQLLPLLEKAAAIAATAPK